MRKRWEGEGRTNKVTWAFDSVSILMMRRRAVMECMVSIVAALGGWCGFNLIDWVRLVW